jgi:alcohol dehydrogenase
MFYHSDWSFFNPVNINFGLDAINKLPSLIPAQKGLLITTHGFTRRGLTEKIRLLLEDYDLEILDEIEPNPDINSIEAYRHKYSEQDFQFLVGVGGGSVLDTTKALS